MNGLSTFIKSDMYFPLGKKNICLFRISSVIFVFILGDAAYVTVVETVLQRKIK